VPVVGEKGKIGGGGGGGRAHDREDVHSPSVRGKRVDDSTAWGALFQSFRKERVRGRTKKKEKGQLPEGRGWFFD